MIGTTILTDGIKIEEFDNLTKQVIIMSHFDVTDQILSLEKLLIVKVTWLVLTEYRYIAKRINPILDNVHFIVQPILNDNFNLTYYDLYRTSEEIINSNNLINAILTLRIYFMEDIQIIFRDLVNKMRSAGTCSPLSAFPRPVRHSLDDT